LTFRPTTHLDKKHTVFGKLVGGEDVLDTIEKMPIKLGTERPAKPIRITEVIVYVPLIYCSSSHRPRTHPCIVSYQDPFDEYKKRYAKKLSRQAAAEASENTPGEQPSNKPKDDVNWFGLKVASQSAAFGTGEGGAGGVGKYLSLGGGSSNNLKRPQASSNGSTNLTLEEPKKKRKLGFGDFENW
jgi:peptidyl-prolyl cis-trans isomerase-like protein 2